MKLGVLDRQCVAKTPHRRLCRRQCAVQSIDLLGPTCDDAQARHRILVNQCLGEQHRTDSASVPSFGKIRLQTCHPTVPYQVTRHGPRRENRDPHCEVRRVTGDNPLPK